MFQTIPISPKRLLRTSVWSLQRFLSVLGERSVTTHTARRQLSAPGWLSTHMPYLLPLLFSRYNSSRAALLDAHRIHKFSPQPLPIERNPSKFCVEEISTLSRQKTFCNSSIWKSYLVIRLRFAHKKSNPLLKPNSLIITPTYPILTLIVRIDNWGGVSSNCFCFPMENFTLTIRMHHAWLFFFSF